ncbi:MAG: uroporphyrinogen decarboxylase [Gammaproteobacteria bacterium]|nr:uroporphyrinogen decarboxylase [Gammaproteobacteria bacterium]
MPEKLLNDRLLRALRRQPVDVTPVWIMRQAGRYLPEYRATRQRAGDFMTLCKTPELACEVTLQPLQRFDLDAAILFSDILTIPDAMGLGLSVVENKGPQFARPLRSGNDIRNLTVPDMETDLGYVPDAVRLIKRELQGKVPLIGFAGSPWTIATYMIEGGSSKNFSKAKGMLYGQSEQLHRLLELLSRAITDYLNAQIAAGVDVVMLFDSWGGILSHAAYSEFSLAYMRRIIQGLRAADAGRATPIILFTKGGGLWIEDIAKSGCDAIGLDWSMDIELARKSVGAQVALQGNLDTAVLYSSPASIRRQVAEVLAAYGQGEGHVFNLGHGIHPDIDPDQVAVLVDAVHELSRPYHAG